MASYSANTIQRRDGVSAPMAFALVTLAVLITVFVMYRFQTNEMQKAEAERQKESDLMQEMNKRLALLDGLESKIQALTESLPDTDTDNRRRRDSSSQKDVKKGIASCNMTVINKQIENIAGILTKKASQNSVKNADKLKESIRVLAEVRNLCSYKKNEQAQLGKFCPNGQDLLALKREKEEAVLELANCKCKEGDGPESSKKDLQIAELKEKVTLLEGYLKKAREGVKSSLDANKEISTQNREASNQLKEMNDNMKAAKEGLQVAQEAQCQNALQRQKKEFQDLQSKYSALASQKQAIGSISTPGPKNTISASEQDMESIVKDLQNLKLEYAKQTEEIQKLKTENKNLRLGLTAKSNPGSSSAGKTIIHGTGLEGKSAPKESKSEGGISDDLTQMKNAYESVMKSKENCEAKLSEYTSTIQNTFASEKEKIFEQNANTKYIIQALNRVKVAYDSEKKRREKCEVSLVGYIASYEELLNLTNSTITAAGISGKGSLEAFEAQMNDLVTLRIEKRETEKIIGKLKELKESSEKDLKEAHAELKTLRESQNKRAEDVAKEIQKLEAKENKCSSNLKELDDAMKKQKEVSNGLREQIAQGEAERKELSKQADKKEKACEAERNEAKVSIESLHQNNRELTMNLQNEKQTFRKEIEECKSQTKLKEDELATAKADIKESKAELEKIKTEMQTLFEAGEKEKGKCTDMLLKLNQQVKELPDLPS
eukprot:Nk52_evm2s2297 gene=Nk52_evmTU2s2297